MSNGRLFVSFWHICLENLPEGTFRKRQLTPKDAKRRIERARAKQRLLCVSEDDLLAPYRKDERDNHKDLCRVLNEHFGISLQLEDFFDHGGEDDPGYSIRPLSLFQVSARDRLLVVTCCYDFEAKRTSRGKLRFSVAPDSIEFHLFEVCAT